MKGFLKKIALFLFPLVLLSFFADRIISQVKRSVMHAYGEYSVWNDLYEGKANAEILIHGSSRALVHIDPLLIEDSLEKSTYNLGVDGHNFRLQYLRHELILDGAQKPKMVIHSLDMYTLEKRNDLYNPDQFLPYLWCNTKMWHAISDYKGYKYADYALPLVRYYGKTEAIMTALKCIATGTEKNEPGRIRGFRSEEWEWNDDLKNARKKIKNYRVKLHIPSIRLFENYLAKCARDQTKVILVYSPDHYEGRDFVTNRDTILNLYRQLAEKHKIRFLDYSQDSMCMSKKWFYNSSHLNKAGATAFTQKLISDLKKDTN